MPTETGIYTPSDANIGHLHSTNLCKKISTIFHPSKKVIDFGCGLGEYLSYLKNLNYEVIGIDGINVSKNPFIVEMDLSHKISLGFKGSVISLEVGEHIPEFYEDNFIDNLVNHCDDKMILSWAVVGQPGIGHINCKNNDYIINRLQSKGFYFDKELSEWLRDDIEEHCSYFKNTLMAFNKK